MVFAAASWAGLLGRGRERVLGGIDGRRHIERIRNRRQVGKTCIRRHGEPWVILVELFGYIVWWRARKGCGLDCGGVVFEVRRRSIEIRSIYSMLGGLMLDIELFDRWGYCLSYIYSQEPIVWSCMHYSWIEELLLISSQIHQDLAHSSLPWSQLFRFSALYKKSKLIEASPMWQNRLIPTFKAYGMQRTSFHWCFFDLRCSSICTHF